MTTINKNPEIQHPANLCAEASASLSQSVLELWGTISPLPSAESPHNGGSKLKQQILARATFWDIQKDA